MDDKELIQKASHGDLSAFNQLVLKYQDLIFNHAQRLLGNQDMAEDIAQEAFILAFRKLHQYRGGSFRAWLLRIVTNLCYSEMRTWKRSSFLALEPLNKDGETNESPYWIQDPGPLPEEIVETGELHEKLEHALQELPTIYRNAVSLIDIQELSYKEAASVMGVPVGTVRSRLARGRMQIQESLKDMDAHSTSEQGVFNRRRKNIIASTDLRFCPSC